MPKIDCGHIDTDVAAEAIKKTRETGNEHAFVVCEDGTHSDIVSGSGDRVDITVDCDGKAAIFHTHPNDVIHLSDQDMSVLKHEDIEMVCAGDRHGNMKCEVSDGSPACVRDFKDGEGSALAMASYTPADGTEYQLAILPKGSRCVDYKSVPSRSSYHNSDSVDRCDTFGPPGSDADTPAPTDDAPDLPDVPGELGDGAVTLETSEWNQYVIPALREAAAIASRQDNSRTAINLKEAADTLDDESGKTRSLKDQVKGDWNVVVWALRVIGENAESADDGKKLTGLADSIEEQAKSADEPDTRMDVPETVGKFELVTEEIDDEPLTLEYEASGYWIGGYPATLPSDEELTVVVRIYQHGGAHNHKSSFSVKWWVGEREGSATKEDRKKAARDRDDPGKAFRQVGDKAVSWMYDNEPADEPQVDTGDGMLDGEEYPLDPNGWEHVDTESFGGPSSAVAVWYRPIVNRSNPAKPYEYVVITDRSQVGGSGTGYKVETKRGPHPDDVGSSTDLDVGRSLMPKKRTGVGRYDKVSASRAIELAVDHMEEYDPKDHDHSYAPSSIDIRGEARQFRYIADQISRAYLGSGDPDINIRISGTEAEMVMVDSANVLMGVFNTRQQGFEQWDVSGETLFSTKAKALSELLKQANITETLSLFVKETPEGQPPKLGVRIDGSEAGGVFMLPERDRLRKDEMLPDFDEPFEAGVKLQGNEFRKAVRFVGLVGPMNGGFALRSDGDQADLVAEGDVDTSRAVLDDDPSGVKAAGWFSKDYMENISVIPKPASTTVHIQWSTDFPLQQTYGRGDDHYMIEQWLAPRIIDDDPWDIEDATMDMTDLPCLFDSPLELHAAEYTESSSPSLRRAWLGYKIAVAEDETEQAKQYAAVINGIRAANGDDPIEFDALDGFRGIDDEPDKSLSAPEGDVILWFHPKAQGCRCSSQAVQLNHIARNNDATVIGVNTESEEHNREFVETYGLNFPIVSDDGRLLRQFGVKTNPDGLPKRTTVFLRDGEEIDRVTGLFGSKDVKETLQQCGCGHMESSPPEILEHVEHPSVVTITGQRRSGKSSLAYHLAEELYQHEGIPPVTVNVPESTSESLPGHWTNVASINNTPENAVVVYDEAYRSIHARTPMGEENLDLTEIVELSAQRGQTILFVTQNSAILDKVAVGESDVMMIKKPGKLSMQFERAQIRSLSEDARERFEMLPESADHREYVYVYGEDGEAFVENGEAPFYDDGISRSFARFEFDDADDDCEMFVR